MTDDEWKFFNPYVKPLHSDHSIESSVEKIGAGAIHGGWADDFATGYGGVHMADALGTVGALGVADVAGVAGMVDVVVGREWREGSSALVGADHFVTGGAPSGDALVSSRAANPPSGPYDSLCYVPGQLLLQRYRLLHKVGEGGMGEVWKAVDQTTGGFVAIKRLHPMLLLQGGHVMRRFARESEILSQLTHPLIVRLSAHHLPHGFFVMEWLEGRTLSATIEAQKRFDLEDVIAILWQLCLALTEIHEHGLIHRDIKPTNIHLKELRHTKDSPHWEIKLLDFGIAWTSEGTQLTRTRGGLVGSPYYIAPELLQGQTPTPQVDVYSLGVLLYELFAGEVPLAGSPNLEDAARKLLADGLIDDSECPPEVEVEYLRLIRQELMVLLTASLERVPGARCTLEAFKARLLGMHQSYMALRDLGQRRRKQSIQQVLNAGKIDAAIDMLEEAARIYPESRTWSTLREQIDREETRKSRLVSELSKEWRTIQSMNPGRKRRRQEAEIRARWDNAVARGMWPQYYRSDPFDALLQPVVVDKSGRVLGISYDFLLGGAAFVLFLMTALLLLSVDNHQFIDALRFDFHLIRQEQTHDLKLTSALERSEWVYDAEFTRFETASHQIRMSENKDADHDLVYSRGFKSRSGILVLDVQVRLGSLHKAHWGWLAEEAQAGFLVNANGQLALRVWMANPRVHHTKVLSQIDVTAWHRYRIAITSNLVRFFVDETLVASYKAQQIHQYEAQFHIGQRGATNTHILEAREAKIIQGNRKSQIVSQLALHEALGDL